MNKFRSQYLKSGAIIVFLFLLYAKGHSQTIDDSNQQDSSKNEMLHEDGKNYVPAYSFYIHSLYPSLVEPVLIDTTVFHPYCEDISLYSRNLYANTGIFGRANYSMNFSFYRKHGFVYKTYPWNDYLRTIENWEMFSLKEVYTRLEYNFANGKENHFSVTHAQQITEDVYFGFGLESIIAQGRYVMQRIRDVNMGVILQYKHPSGRYGVNVRYLFNLISNQENGGLIADSAFEQGILLPTAMKVRFTGATSRLSQHTVFLRHYLALSSAKKETGELKNKAGYLVHDVEYSNDKGSFTDFDVNPDNFQRFLFSTDTTTDFTRYYQIRNTLMWSSYMPDDTLPDKKNFIHFAAGMMHTFLSLKDTFSLYQDYQFTPVGALHIKLFDILHIKASALITLNGYNAGDITFDGTLAMDFLRSRQHKHQAELSVAFCNYAPDFFFTHLVANNYAWANQLKKQQTLTAGVAWKHNHYSVGLNYFTLHNYTLLNEDCFPVQTNDFVNVYQLAAYIPFQTKGFGSTSNIYLQYTANKQVRIPVFAARQTLYYGFFLFKKALYLQTGFDFLYNTTYYANAYNPVLQQFYLQNEKEIGNYGYLDFYLRAKIGRFQFQFKLTHLWAGLFGRNYYLIPHYPAKDLGFALGIVWRFHD